MLKEVCYSEPSIVAPPPPPPPPPPPHFFYGSIINSEGHLKRSTRQRHCVYLTAIVAATHYNKRSVVDSRKREEYF